MENKIYAVRRPAEAKGVYLTVDEMKKMQRQHPKGFSVKPFEAKDVELAKEWAGVKGTSGTPILTVKKKVAQKEETTVQSVKKKHPIQAVLDSYQEKGYRHFELTLVSGESVYITPEDLVYIPDLKINFDLVKSVDLSNYRENPDSYYSSLHSYEMVILASLNKATKKELSYVKDALQWELIDLLEKTTIDYCEDFILLTNFNYQKEKVYLKKNDGYWVERRTINLIGNYVDEENRRPKDRCEGSSRYTILKHANQTVAINLNQIAKIQPIQFEMNTSGINELQHLLPLVKLAKKEMRQEKS